MINILLIGSGGREYAIAKCITKTSNNYKLFCYGTNNNPGIIPLCEDMIIGEMKDTSNIVKYAVKNNINLCIIGPELPLSLGIVDQLEELYINCIGPTKEYARIETSKSFARNSIKKYHKGFLSYNPNPKFRVFFYNNYNSEDILEYISELDEQYVIKANGLKGGKGVKVVGEHIFSKEEAIKYCEELVNEKSNFIIEEKMVGDEFSLFSFSDGKHLSHMPIVQDYKRAYENNVGPNTGGMGSISDSNHSLPFLTKEDVTIAKSINTMVIKILHKIYDGRGYKGILYGSFIKTVKGEIKVIEYNCRFGDPECINVLSLLKTDFLDICSAIIFDNLNKLEILFEKQASVCKYLVPNGYPNKRKYNELCKDDLYKRVSISRVPDLKSVIFADVSLQNGCLLMNTSRTIAIIAKGNTIEDAYKKVEKNIGKVDGNLFYRKDIGKYITTRSINKENINMYSNSGVDIEKGNQAIKSIQEYVKSTFNSNVVNDFGEFGGIIQLNESKSNESESNQTLLVSSIDGVGTKSLLVTNLLGKKGYYKLGHDIVNHSVNDIMVQGAMPLFFLDYFAVNTLETEYFVELIRGITDACKKVNCVLIGGETAEMPGIYRHQSVDIVGAIVGTLKKENYINGKKNIKKGDKIVAIRSSGFHTNGYSLIRKIISSRNLELTSSIIERLSEPHRCYYKEIKTLFENNINIHGLCHITGGGLIDNPPRILPKELGIKLNKEVWELPEIFKWIQKHGYISNMEMYQVFNCGLGMLLFVDETDVKKIKELINDVIVVGDVIECNNECITKVII